MRLQIFGIAVLATCLAKPSAGQEVRDSICIAAQLGFGENPSGALWPDEAWGARQDTIPRSTAYVAKQLGGAYRLVEIESEGGGPSKYFREWQLILKVPHPDSLAHWKRGWARGDIPLAGHRQLKRYGPLGGSIVASTDANTMPIRLTDFGRNVLMLEADGGLYSLASVDVRGNFFGRWVEGTNVILAYPDAGVAEQARGYFCAFRE